jgi:hypothetical protein
MFGNTLAALELPGQLNVAANNETRWISCVSGPAQVGVADLAELISG